MNKKYKKNNLTIKFKSGEDLTMAINGNDLNEIFAYCHGFRNSKFVDLGREVINVDMIEYFVYDEVKEDEL
ncbi:hypothetical protein [Gemella haemolysans]|uniref:Uncharacterized protein n=1 Tax=Gemella haemolysans M341 TaxID=562981 RepID=A0AA87DVM9_9BACL|nr:hypothetical protein [Gemella haemolysans]EGF88476.1 hypothetical protein HMPREF0428_00994 [Gemella haemolysans M341]